MQKRSHTLLASALLRSRDGFDARRFELAFLFGSFQPDCNPFSYLKGSLRARKFGGHNYTNSHDYIYDHILRLQQGSCSIESGFVWSDLLTALERVGDHCSNIAGCVIDLHNHDLNTHEALRSARMENEDFGDAYRAYAQKYSLK